MFDKIKRLFLGNQDALTQLRAEQPKRFRFEMSANGSVKVDIMGEIDAWWGFGVRELNYLLSQHPTKPVEVFINSGGGDLIEAIAIANTLRNHPASISTIGIGMVGSATTVIHGAADKGKAYMMDGSTYFVHEVSLVTGGRSSDLRKSADLVEQFNDVVANMYAEKIADKTPDAYDSIRNMMAEETYMTAQQAVQLGFADAIYNPIKITNNMSKVPTALDTLLEKSAKVLNQVEVEEPTTEIVEDVPVNDTADVEALKAENAQLTEALTNAITALSGLTNRVTALEKARNLTSTQKTVEQPKAANPLEKAQQVLNAAIAAKNQN